VTHSATLTNSLRLSTPPSNLVVTISGPMEQLEEWLAEDGVLWSGRELGDAVEQLEVAGLLSRPHRERELAGPLPGYLITPSWDRGY
jgi:hypothetical protein